MGNATPLKDNTAFKDTPAARIANHNDAFMTDRTNMGTYEDIDKEKSYIAQDALYVPLGGETAEPPSGVKWATGEEAWNEVNYLHWSFLNDAYYKKLLNKWEAGGYFNKIKKFLGYRLALTKIEYSEQNAPGSDLTVNLLVNNYGTACMYNPRLAILVLSPTDGGREYIVSTGLDFRMVKPGKPTNMQTKLKLPENMPEGKYKLLLWLPDKDKKLQENPKYAVRLANTTTWEEQTGYNDLNITLNVAKDKNAKPGTSSLVFSKKERPW